ncbi:MAG: Stp1/IreP family PP2C-type Ser/Thr phosphatase [Ruminiclostridium sp.]|nr:Stp1/IreP family PP2C-type Ser/Thr phosphatase [Ruminiclostridium sp.]
MDYAALSDKGIIREQNEDFWNIVLDNKGNPIAFIIADGMGGHKAGDVASRMAVEIISQEICRSLETINSSTVIAFLENAVNLANDEIYKYSLLNLNGTGIGTTLTLGLIHNGKITIAHIGDSRFYLIRGGAIQSMTRDHSFVGELVEKGVLDQEEARNHPLRNQITRALGYEKNIEIDFYNIDVKKGDMYLFCTDGLTVKVSSDELLTMLEQEKDLDITLKNMVELANQRGGDDNITAIIVKI